MTQSTKRRRAAAGRERPTMVFHAPYPMEANPTSASRLRPLRMRAAFHDLGYRVFDASGTVAQRRGALRELRKYLRAGGKVDFLYSENSTQPNLLATSLKAGVAPLVDYLLMREVARTGARVGVFYRDIYWKFEIAEQGGLYQQVKPALHRLDLEGYRRNGAHLFLPSMKMADLVDATNLTCSALPPAGDPHVIAPLPKGDLTCIYVGGIGAHYNLDAFFTALEQTEGVRLKLCTRKDQWENLLENKPGLPQGRVEVAHLNANQLGELYAQSHVGVLAVDPDPYRAMAAPVKLFEYLSYGRPIIVTRPTHAADLVEEIGAGWVVDATSEAITELLQYLRDHPEEVEAKARIARRAAADHTWKARAREVVRTLFPQSSVLEGN